MEKKRSSRNIQNQKSRIINDPTFFENLLNVAQVIILVLDQDGRIININPYMEEITGYRLREVEGKDWFDTFLPTRDREKIRLLFTQAVGDIQTKGNINPIVSKDGNEIFVEWHDKIIQDSKGKTIGLLAIGLDITDRLNTEEALRKSEQRLQAIFCSTADYLMLLDTNHKIQMINRVEPGQDLKEIIGIPLYELVSLHDQQRVRAILDRVMVHGEKQKYDTTYQRPDGTMIYFSSIASPIKADGKLIGSVVSSRDISERIRLQHEKEQLEQQYRQSQKMEAIGRLAGGIAHDFNNLLTVINSYATLTSTALHEADPLKEDILQILEAGKRAAVLTGQLLAFSRRQVLQMTSLNLNDVVIDLEKMLKRLIGEDIEFHISLTQDLGYVRADPAQIEQVLMNLVINARDAMPKGGKLTIETANTELDRQYAANHPDTTEGCYVMLAVTDTGIGMPKETIDHVFEPFFTTKEKGHGTGLGLSTVYGIIKQSGGNIWVYSEPRKGTTFKIYLPREENLKTERTPKPVLIDCRGTETILVVEDEKAVRDLTRRVLTSAGYQVITAANAGEALLECERTHTHIDLILTDVVIPKMSGIELVNRLSLIIPNPKVLYMSGYTENTIVHHGVLDEGTHFIAKPFTTVDLLKKVRTVLDSG